MGCLKNITRAIFLTVVIVGFMAFGGQDWIKNKLMIILTQVKMLSLNELKKSEIFQRLIKNLKLKSCRCFRLQCCTCRTQSKRTKIVGCRFWQKVVLSQADITSPNVEDKIKAAINKIKYQSAAIEEFHVTERGTMKSYGQKFRM